MKGDRAGFRFWMITVEFFPVRISFPAKVYEMASRADYFCSRFVTVRKSAESTAADL